MTFLGFRFEDGEVPPQQRRTRPSVGAVRALLHRAIRRRPLHDGVELPHGQGHIELHDPLQCPEEDRQRFSDGGEGQAVRDYGPERLRRQVGSTCPLASCFSRGEESLSGRALGLWPRLIALIDSFQAFCGERIGRQGVRAGCSQSLSQVVSQTKKHEHGLFSGASSASFLLEFELSECGGSLRQKDLHP